MADLDRPEVIARIVQAAEPHAAAFDVAPPLTTIVRMAIEKQRPRRSSGPALE